MAYPQSFEYNVEGLKGILDFLEEAQTRFSTSTQRTKRQGAYVEGEILGAELFLALFGTL